MRVEVHGCPYRSPLSSYKSPLGEEFSPGVILEDVYDGDEEEGILSGGLGLLTDGVFGKDSIFVQQKIVKGKIEHNAWIFCRISSELSVWPDLQNYHNVSREFNRPDKSTYL